MSRFRERIKRIEIKDLNVLTYEFMSKENMSQDDIVKFIIELSMELTRHKLRIIELEEDLNTLEDCFEKTV